MEVSPVNGGCWFCYKDDGEMDFSVEFDCYFHMNCLLKEIAKGLKNEEAEIIAMEFGLKKVSKLLNDE